MLLRMKTLNLPNDNDYYYKNKFDETRLDGEFYVISHVKSIFQC